MSIVNINAKRPQYGWISDRAVSMGWYGTVRYRHAETGESVEVCCVTPTPERKREHRGLPDWRCVGEIGEYVGRGREDSLTIYLRECGSL